MMMSFMPRDQECIIYFLRFLSFCCLQETRWKGGSAKSLGKEEAMYKFLWAGCEGGLAGVGILVAKK